MKKVQSKLLLTGAILLLFAGGFYSCSKSSDTTPPVDKTAFKAEITTATALAAGAVEGVAAGDYLKGSTAVLQTAITAANVVANDPAATQTQVTAALASLTAAVTLFNGQLVVAIDPTNLVGQWTFDEITAATVGANVKDYSGNSHNGTIKQGNDYWGAMPPPGAAGSGGIPTLTADRYGIAGKALHFDKGANVEIPYATSLNPAMMSLSVWAKPDVNNPIVNNQYIISMNRWNGWKWNFQDTPRAFFTTSYDDVAGALTDHCCLDRDQNVGTAPQGAWHHYIMTFGGGHEIFYIDGVLVYDWSNFASDATISTLPVAVNLVFGQDLPTTGYSTVSTDPNYLNYGGYYIGALDEVRMYKSVLTPAQVTAIYNLEKP